MIIEEESEAREASRIKLATELSACPELYDALLRILTRRPMSSSHSPDRKDLLTRPGTADPTMSTSGGINKRDGSTDSFHAVEGTPGSEDGDQGTIQNIDGKLIIDSDVLRYFEDQKTLLVLGEE